ncbi:MAG: uroporphyrinogen decarboxylase family protein [Betaproteobacteria bacterium]
MASPDQNRGVALKALESFGVPQAGIGHDVKLGHGISQFTPPESVTALVDAVHAYSREQRRRGASASSL